MKLNKNSSRQVIELHRRRATTEIGHGIWNLAVEFHNVRFYLCFIKALKSSCAKPPSIRVILPKAWIRVHITAHDISNSRKAFHRFDTNCT